MEEKKYFHKLNKEKSNRGEALIMVIIVMTVVSILGLLSLSVAYDSFRMKNVDRRATDNFYGAEKILEEICVELQEDVSELYTETYTEIMTKYNTYDTAEEMQYVYEKAFYQQMAEKLRGEEGQTGYYDLDIIRAYVADRNYDSTIVTIDADTEKNFLDKTNEGLYIRNIYVRYEDDGYSDTITTDIKIEAPPVVFEKIAEMPSITEYALIADGGLELTGATENSITGKVFAGLLEETEVSVKLLNKALFTVEDGELITAGDIELEKNAGFTTDGETTLWANSVTTLAGSKSNPGMGNSVKLLGTTYIKDDITINGKANTLKLSGKYYGYSGSSKKAEDSSAIIVNGVDTVIDMSQLDTLVLSGTSFVGTQGESYSLLSEIDPKLKDVNKSDVLMGDSVAVKSNQLVYMVPVECEGIESNPMTYDQYKKLITDTEWESKALSTYINGLDRTIISYGNVKITPVFTNKMGGMVYLYLEFASTEAASQFFMDSYGNTENGQKVQQYLTNYVDKITFNQEISHIQTAGNYLVEISEGTPAYQKAIGEIKDVNLEEAYEKLCEEIRFKNLINIHALKDLVGEDGIYTETLEVQQDENNQKTKIEIIVIDNADSGEVYKINNDFKGVLIATGDVCVVGGEGMNIEGLILCQGKLRVEGTGINLDTNLEVISQALRIADENGIDAMNIFKGNSGNSVQNTENEAEEIDIRNCITFENWKAG